MYVPSPGWITGFLEMTHLPLKYMGCPFAFSCTQTRTREVV